MASVSAEPNETFKIYFVMESDQDYTFYKIPDDQPPPSGKDKDFLVPLPEDDDITGDDDESSPIPKFLRPDFKFRLYTDSKKTYSGCAAVGSTMYLFGGDSDANGVRCHSEVWSIEIGEAAKGWKKGVPMKYARTGHIGVSANNKICAIGGYDRSNSAKIMPIEVYNPEDGSWETKCQLDCSYLRDSAVFDGGKRALLLTSARKLLIYYVNDGIIGNCPIPDPEIPISTMTVLGETLYAASFSAGDEFQLFGLDFLNNKEGGGDPVKVTGLDTLMEDRSDYLLPETTYEIGKHFVLFPQMKLLAIGKNKLAVLWTLETDFYSYVNCLKMEIHRMTLVPIKCS